MSRVAATVALAISRALVCADCDTVFSPQPRCPRCSSSHFFPLATWLDRKEK